MAVDAERLQRGTVSYDLPSMDVCTDTEIHELESPLRENDLSMGRPIRGEMEKYPSGNRTRQSVSASENFSVSSRETYRECEGSAWPEAGRVQTSAWVFYRATSGVKTQCPGFRRGFGVRDGEKQ